MDGGIEGDGRRKGAGGVWRGTGCSGQGRRGVGVDCQSYGTGSIAPHKDLSPRGGNFWTDRTDPSTVGGMKTLQLQEAKQQFSAVAERAAGGQPQVVTKHGKPFVVILGVDAWRKGRVPKRTVLEALRACPVDLTGLDLSRSREPARDPGL